MKHHLQSFKIMIFLLSLLFFHSLKVSAQQLAVVNHEDRPEKQDDRLISLESALKELEVQLKISLNYDYKTIENRFIKAAQLKKIDADIDKSLRSILNPLELNYEEIDKGYYIIFEKGKKKVIHKIERSALSTSLQNSYTVSVDRVNQASRRMLEKTVSGKVTDAETHEPLPGVNILAKGTTQGTVTDIEGLFHITVGDDVSTLVFSSIGYLTQEIEINGQSELNVALAPDVQSLQEVVVVGYGEQKKVNLTGAVDNITSKRLSALQVNTIGEALQGQLPGVHVTTADGKPGRSAGFNIRGNTSINGGGPLIVIDGVPQSEADLNNISPYDIEEISVLKDAASTAIYGARASFGVILVTTKRGSKGLNIQYNNYFGFSKATRIPEVYDNPLDYIEINENEFNANIGHTYFTDAQVAYPRLVASDPSLPYAKVEDIGGRPNLLLGGKVYNYYKEWLREYSPKQNHRLSVSGAGDKFQYYISGDFNYEEGALKFKPEKINRYTLRSNLTYKINDNISIFNNTGLVKRNEEHPNQYLYGFTSNVWRFIENSNAMMPEYVEIDGEMIPTDIGFYREFIEKQSGIQEGIHNARTTLGLDLNALDNTLKLHLDWTYQFGNTEYLRWWDNTGPYLSNSFNNRNIVLDYYSDAGPARIYRSMWRTITGNANAYATYNMTFGKNNITILGGYNQENYDYLYTYADRENPMQMPQHSLNLATGVSNTSDDDDRNASRSLFTRVNYNWDEKYLLEINGSYFLSSKFARENRGHAFLAASGAWRISEETFFEPLQNVVNNFKIRASYGSIGNADIGSYDYIPIMSVSQSSFTLEGERVNYTSAPSPRSANFTWESVETINFGADIGVLKNRLTGSLDIYQRNTRNMLANFRSLPSVFGAAVPKENIASLQNRGWELGLNWSDKFQLSRDDFNYGIRFNLSDYTAVITEYYNPTNYLGDYYVGQEIGEIWGLTTLGYFKTDEEAQNGALLGVSPIRAYAAAGTIKFDDVNNDNIIDFGDRTLDNPGDYKIIGNSTPRYQYGITLNASWKGFDFNSFFRGVGKMDIYPGPEAVNFWGPYNRKYQVMIKHTVENRWTPENPDAYFPRPQGYLALGDRDLGQPQTKYLQNASFLRLKSLTLGYTLPVSFINRLRLSNIRVYATGQNLWEATSLHFSLDPEGLAKDPDANQGSVGIGTAYPIQRVYAFGVQVQF